MKTNSGKNNERHDSKRRSNPNLTNTTDKHTNRNNNIITKTSAKTNNSDTHTNKATLPDTGEDNTSLVAILGAFLITLASIFGINLSKKKQN